MKNHFVRKYNSYVLNESSISRVWQHSQRGFFVISAYLNLKQYIINNINNIQSDLNEYELDIIYRDLESYTENEKEIYSQMQENYSKELMDYNINSDGELKLSIKNYNLGFIQQMGRYTNRDTNTAFNEPSYLVPFYDKKYDWNEFENVAIELMDTFYQESILLCKHTDKNTYEVGLLFNDGTISMLQNKIEIFPIDAQNKFLSILKYGPHSDRAYSFAELSNDDSNLLEKIDIIGFKSNVAFGNKENYYSQNSKQIFV